MPPVYRVYGQFADQVTDRLVIRLQGPNRKAMDQRAGKDWSKIVEPRDGKIHALAQMLRDLRERKRKVCTFVNNHYEGCAPLTSNGSGSGCEGVGWGCRKRPVRSAGPIFPQM